MVFSYKVNMELTKQEYTACRICNEYVESTDLYELFNVYTKIAAQIKKVIGVELLNSSEIPSSICRQCNSAFESAQDFRLRCIESNGYFEIKREQNIKCEAEVGQKEQQIKEELVKSGNNEFTENEEFGQNHDDEGEISTSISTIISQCGRKISSKKKEFKVNWKQKEQSNTANKCDICGFVSKSKSSLRLHILRMHSNRKPYGCEQCSSTFCTNSELTRHIRKHTGEKPYECKYCRRKFADYTTKTKHERTHTKERPYSCTQCDKSFARSSILKIHMLLHTDERPFRCQVCDKSFKRQYMFRNHMKTIYHQRIFFKKTNEDKIV